MILLTWCAVAGAATLGPDNPPRISVKEILDLQEKGETVLFIDTRTANQWQRARHKIPGAIRLNNNRDILDLAGRYPANTTIVTYCT
jgi:rhodanese-related sulfurtransferase